jgi:hypothetical protein
MSVETFFQDYSKVSTIGGMVHMFRPDLSFCKRLFWIITLLTMLSVGIYWSVAILEDWKSNPVLVTINSVGKKYISKHVISHSAFLTTDQSIY